MIGAYMATTVLDKLAGLFGSAIASIQENTQLKADNAQLKATNADLQTRLDAVTGSLNQDEQEKADQATKLASLEQLVAQFEAASAAPAADSSTPVVATATA